MSKKLIIRIRPDGRIEANTSGIKGKECMQYIKVLEQLLDADTYNSEFTEEYYQENETVENLQKTESINPEKIRLDI